jgi:predicted flap endonuclease-1-like 5' DNA nuclease
LAEAREALGEAEARAEGLDKQREEAERALQGASEEAAAQQAAKLNEAGQRAKASSEALEQARRQLAEAETEAKALARKLDIEAAKHQTEAEQLASVEAELTACRERVAALEAGAAAPVSTATEPEAEATDDQTSARAAVEEIARRTAGERPAPDDDLKRIKGIGPVLERQLKAMGITSFRQIAQFSNEDIERVSTALGAFRGRILRDNWPEGARAAHRDQYGEEI